ncbi:MAG: hypothetical protein ACJARD_000443 [Alphaproteobacteria bacterium]|jgi:hypothetical protein
MNMRIEDGKSEKPKKRSRAKRNVRIRQRQEKTPEAKAATEAKVIPEDNRTDIPVVTASVIPNENQSNIPLVKAVPVLSEDALEKLMPSKATEAVPRKSLKEKRLSARQKRQDRQAKRKRDLLEGAIQKLKTQNGDSDALTSLEESINKQHGDPVQSSVETSISQNDLLADANPKAPAQTTKSEQSAKDRFKNALKALNKNKVDDDPVNTSKTHKDHLQATAFKDKMAERQRIKKVAGDYLEKMGLNYTNNDFKNLSNAIADNLLFNIEQTLPRYKKTVEKLIERETLPVRNGNNQAMLGDKKTKTEEIVGSLFSHIPIGKGNDHIMINLNRHNQDFKIPDNNADLIRDDLLESLLFYKDATSKNTIDPYQFLNKKLSEDEEEEEEDNRKRHQNQSNDDEEENEEENEEDERNDDKTKNHTQPNNTAQQSQSPYTKINMQQVEAFKNTTTRTASKLSTLSNTSSSSLRGTSQGSPQESQQAGTSNMLQNLLQKKMANRDKSSNINLLKSRLKDTTEKFKSLKK